MSKKKNDIKTVIINSVDNGQMQSKYNFLEVCAGCGGLSSGLIKAGMIPILLNDNDKNCCETLKLNHKDVNIKCCSMTDLKIIKYIHKIDLLVGGVPCQSFSQSGMRKGLNDDRCSLLLKFIDMINKIEPKIFMIENVRGLVTYDHGNTIKKVIDLLSESDLYDVKYKVLNGVNYNVPQKRERVIITGVLKKFDVSLKYPKKNDNIITVSDALKNVPESKGCEYSEKKKKLFKLIPQCGCWIDLPKDKQKEYLGKSYKSGGGKRGILRRLSMKEPSLTILCSPS